MHKYYLITLIVAFYLSFTVHAASWLDPEPWRYERKQCRCSCGISRREQRIVGGRPTEDFDYPWMAGLTYKGHLYCGGALINDRHVMTAAHCIDGLDINSVHILLGDHDLREINDTDIQLRSIASWTKHPKFGRKTFNNDIALIRLDSPISFTRSIGPVCLPTADWNYTGLNGIVTGWGRTSESGPISPVLRQVEVPIYSNPACQKTKYAEKAITENMLCAGYDKGKLDACQGDSGGPLHLEGKDRKMDIIGIVSWGQGCGRPGYPGVYTRVGRYLKWIAENTKDGCYCGRRHGRDS